MGIDAEKAKALLERNEYTCVLCRGEAVSYSCHRGVRPLVDFLDSGVDYAGFSAADKVVGKATAFLYVLLGVREVYAGVLSDAAAAVFERYGISFSCGQRVPAIRNRDNTGFCPMEQATRDIQDPAQALAAVRNTLKKLQ